MEETNGSEPESLYLEFYDVRRSYKYTRGLANSYQFVYVHRQLLAILNGKASLFNTVPFIGEPVEKVLRKEEFVFKVRNQTYTKPNFDSNII